MNIKENCDTWRRTGLLEGLKHPQVAAFCLQKQVNFNESHELPADFKRFSIPIITRLFYGDTMNNFSVNENTDNLKVLNLGLKFNPPHGLDAAAKYTKTLTEQIASILEEGYENDRDAATQASIEAHDLSHRIPSPESDDGGQPRSKSDASTALTHANEGNHQNASRYHTLSMGNHRTEALLNPVHASMHQRAAEAHRVAAGIHNDVGEEHGKTDVLERTFHGLGLVNNNLFLYYY